MANDANGNTSKTSGYLEKKGKMKVVSSWKKYWFVLEGRSPLVYYRSKDEYEAISPCKGTINLGPPCSIKPIAGSLSFQLETRRNTITLRAENKKEYEKWMFTILQALKQSSALTNNKMNHFRYSSDNLSPAHQHAGKDKGFLNKLIRQNSMPQDTSFNDNSKGTEMVDRLQQMGVQYGGSLSHILISNEKLVCSSQSLNSVKISRESLKENELYNRKSLLKINSSNSLLRNEDENEIFLIENDQFTLPKVEIRNKLKRQKENVYEQISNDSLISEESNKERSSTDNELYSCINERSSSDSSHCGQPNDTLVENVYSFPLEIQKELDNNNVIVENDQYVFAGTPESEYAECISYSSEGIYEDVDKCKKNYRRSFPRGKSEENRESTSSVEFNTNRKKLQMSLSLDQTKPRRKKSFFNKIIRWKRKSKEDKDDDVFKQSPTDSVKSKLEVVQDIEVLTELQKILDAKKIEIEKKIKKTSVSFDIENKHIQENKSEMDRRSNTSDKTIEVKDDANENKNVENVIDNWKPVLPNKNSLRKSNDKFEKKKEQKLKTIDEILDDLDKEKETQESRLKVKELIERFENEEVEMRNKKFAKNLKIEKRHSNDLLRLLEDLAKVTNAPILQPGVTSSLVNSQLSREEWLNFIPIRHRRYSDPDYDIPRPHRSLQITKNVKDEKIQFPEVGEENDKINEKNILRCPFESISPDSLEVNGNKQEPVILQNDQDIDEKLNKFQEEIRKEKVEEVIYACPRQIMANFNPDIINNNYENTKSLQNLRKSFSFEKTSENDQIQRFFKRNSLECDSGIKSLDVFVDSLEPNAEISTIF